MLFGIRHLGEWGGIGRGLDGGYKVRLLGEVPSLVKEKILGHKRGY
jgi:hypothetical protein